MQQFAVFVPSTPHFLAAADVGEGVDHAAVKQADDAGGKSRVHRGAVAAVAVLQHGGAAVAFEVFAVNE